MQEGLSFFGGWRWLKMYCRIAGLGVGGVWGTVLGRCHGYGATGCYCALGLIEMVETFSPDRMVESL